MPRVSVVLPNYNYARYLGERMCSVLQQTYTDFELIVVDDASNDDSLAVIDRFADRRTKVVRRATNSGQVYASWNQGVSHCSGELLLFAGADDYAEPNMLERLVGPFASPDVGLAHCRFLNIDGEGAATSTLIPLHDECGFIVADLERDQDYLAPRPLEWRRLLVTNFIWNASGVLLRREAFDRAGGFDSQLLIAADWLLYLEVARVWNVAYIAEPLNAFRHLPKSVSKKLQGALLIEEMLQCLERQLPYVIDDDARRYFDTGYLLVGRAFKSFIEMNVAANNTTELRALAEIARKRGMNMTIAGMTV